LWFGYLDLKTNLIQETQLLQDTAGAVFDQILQMSKEEQLQAQRDIATGADTDISHAYKALSSSGKLDVWFAAQGWMTAGSFRCRLTINRLLKHKAL